MIENDSSLFKVDVENYNGPLDVLLDLAKSQKVNLEDISITKLADQFHDFIMKEKNLNLEIASEYLLMATWLAYLKSKLLLPGTPEEEFKVQEVAEKLKLQLKKLELIRLLSNSGNQVGNHLAGFTIGSEFPWAFGQLSLLALECNQFSTRQVLSISFDQFRFVVEGVYLAARSRAEDDNDILCPCRKVRLSRSIGVCRIDGRANRGMVVTLPKHVVRVQQTGQGNRTQAGRKFIQKAAAVKQELADGHSKVPGFRGPLF